MTGKPYFTPPDHQADTAWMTKAACACNTHPGWTAEHRPPMLVLRELQAICRSCPVQSDCARYALDEDTHGLYAGVWLPWHPCPERNTARRTLHAKTRPLTKDATK